MVEPPKVLNIKIIAYKIIRIQVHMYHSVLGTDSDTYRTKQTGVYGNLEGKWLSSTTMKEVNLCTAYCLGDDTASRWQNSSICHTQTFCRGNRRTDSVRRIRRLCPVSDHQKPFEAAHTNCYLVCLMLFFYSDVLCVIDEV